MASEKKITAEAFNQRLAKVQKALQERELDGLIVNGQGTQKVGDLTYLSNYRPGRVRNEGFQGAGCHAMVLAAEGPAMLVSPLGQCGEGTFNVNGFKGGNDFNADLAGAVRELGLAGGKLGVAGSGQMSSQVWFTLKRILPKVELVPADEILRDLRAVKSSEEVELLGESARVGEQTIAIGMESVKPGVTEHRLELDLRAAAYEAGADAIAEVTVNSGPFLRDTGCGRTVQAGDLVSLGISGWCEGYAFCATRVVAAGDPGQHQRKQLSHLEEAAQYVVDTLQPNRTVGYVTSLHGGQTILPAAHGIGLELYEHPWIITGPMAGKPVVLPNMVFSVEPILMDGRLGALPISKTVLVTEDGPRVLGMPSA
ncbi:MAG: M24 family metallopeptidase [Deltaproteobacteria bacterium]|nr:M24 family metallopeptidase [Deltaproteobacteria bacterium]